MTNIYIPISIVLSILLLIVIFKSCTSIPEIVTVEKHDTTNTITQAPPQLKHDTVTKWNIQYVPKFFNGNEVYVHDTIIRDGEKIAITPEKYCAEKLEFIAKSDTIKFDTKDTLRATFRYPQMIFDFAFNSKSDTLKTITTTITKLIQQSPFSFGVQVGAGLVRTMNGITDLGIYGGIGFSYKF